MIHICMPLYDRLGTYSKYEAAAICSILENTKKKVVLYILHDDSLTPENKEKFQHMVRKYHQTIIFLEISKKDFCDFETIARNYTIGTLFRFCIMELLPDDLPKVIYLDADIIVNLDIQELWDIDIEDYLIAAVLEYDVVEGYVQAWPCTSGRVPAQEYFNAGVLILNLQAIRCSFNLKKEALDFLVRYSYQCKYVDQDVINCLFTNRVKFLPRCYNLFSRHIRRDNIAECKAIIHAAGYYINIEEPTWFEHLFVKYWLLTPWGTGTEVLSYARHLIALKIKQNVTMQVLLNAITLGEHKIVLWGAKSVMNVELLRFIHLRQGIDYYVDKNTVLQGTDINGIFVYGPNVLLEESGNNVLVIVSSQKYYFEIKKELISYGFSENRNFVDGRLLLSQNQGGYSGYY